MKPSACSGCRSVDSWIVTRHPRISNSGARPVWSTPASGDLQAKRGFFPLPSLKSMAGGGMIFWFYFGGWGEKGGGGREGVGAPAPTGAATPHPPHFAAAGHNGTRRP